MKKANLKITGEMVVCLRKTAKHIGAVKLAGMIGVSKSVLYEILSGNRYEVAPETHARIDGWLDRDGPAAPKQSKKSGESKKSVSIWDDPEFLQIAVEQIHRAILDGRLTGVALSFWSPLKCGK